MWLPCAAAACLVAPRASADEWWGPDKALHFGVSVVLAGGGYAASAPVLEAPWQRAVAGATLSLTLGAAKEAYDATGRGDPSWKDFGWDVAGTAVGVGVALAIDALVRGDHEPRAERRALALRW